MNRRVLLSGEIEPDQRRSLFHTRCKCEDKCCDVIIDGGSTDNLVSEKMVTKLNLKRQKHPRPYRIAWVQDDHKVMVNEQCLVKFKIGSYQDEVLCDVIPMDICHMLLGRPWQFDRHAVHDGRANTYTLTKDGVKHKLKPLQETNEAVCNAAKVCVVDGKKFLDTMRREDVCFAIVPKDGKTEVEEVPAKVVDLLEEFPDIVSDNVPDGLQLV